MSVIGCPAGNYYYTTQGDFMGGLFISILISSSCLLIYLYLSLRIKTDLSITKLILRFGFVIGLLLAITNVINYLEFTGYFLG